MPTLKGPVVLGGNKPIPKEILEVTKLPFRAEGWKSNVNQDLVGKQPIDKVSKNLEEIVESTDDSEKKYTKEELEKLEFNELREIGKELGVKDRSKKGLIKEILEAQ